MALGLAGRRAREGQAPRRGTRLRDERRRRRADPRLVTPVNADAYFSLDGRSARHGGNSGIGRAIALAFAEHGARVAIASRNEERNAAVASELGSQGRAYRLDVADLDAVRATVDSVHTDFGALDIVVNSVGDGPGRTLVRELTSTSSST